MLPSAPCQSVANALGRLITVLSLMKTPAKRWSRGATSGVPRVMARSAKRWSRAYRKWAAWGGEALLDGLWREGRACAGCCVRPVCVGGAGIAGGAEDHHLGEGAACEFALALDEACFACEGVGVVLEDLLERVLDLRCEMGDVFHGALSVPSVWAALKLMPMGRTAVRPACFPLARLAGEGARG